MKIEKIEFEFQGMPVVIRSIEIENEYTTRMFILKVLDEAKARNTGVSITVNGGITIDRGVNVT